MISGYAKRFAAAVNLPAIAKSHYPVPSTHIIDINQPYGQRLGFRRNWAAGTKRTNTLYNPALVKSSGGGRLSHGFKTNVIADTVSDMPLLKIVQAYFDDIGIEMELRTMDPAAWIKYVEIEQQHDQLVYRPYGPLGRLMPRCARLPVFIRLFRQFLQ